MTTPRARRSHRGRAAGGELRRRHHSTWITRTNTIAAATAASAMATQRIRATREINSTARPPHSPQRGLLARETKIEPQPQQPYPAGIRDRFCMRLSRVPFTEFGSTNSGSAGLPGPLPCSDGPADAANAGFRTAAVFVAPKALRGGWQRETARRLSPGRVRGVGLSGASSEVLGGCSESPRPTSRSRE